MASKPASFGETVAGAPTAVRMCLYGSSLLWSGELHENARLLVYCGCLFAATQVAQPVRQVVQRPGEVGQEHVGTGVGQHPVDVHGLFGRAQRVLSVTWCASSTQHLMWAVADAFLVLIRRKPLVKG